MSHYKLVPKTDIEAVSAEQAIMKSAIEMIAKKVKGMSNIDKKQTRNELYGMLMSTFDATKIEDNNQLSIFDDDKIN